MNKVYDKLIATPPGMLFFLCFTLSLAMYGLAGDVFTDVDQAAKMLYTVLTLIGICAVYTASVKSDSIANGHPIGEMWRSTINVIQHSIATAMLMLPFLMMPGMYMFSKHLMTPINIEDVTANPQHVNFMVDQGFDIETSERIVLLEAVGQRSKALQVINEAAEKMDPPMDPIKRFRATRFVIVQ